MLEQWQVEKMIDVFGSGLWRFGGQPSFVVVTSEMHRAFLGIKQCSHS